MLSQVLFSCRPKAYLPQLIEADSICESHADSALSLLKRMAKDTATMSLEERMYYKLLSVKAADKAYITHTSDSLIRQILPYFEDDGDERLLPEVYYYAGRVYSDIGDAPQALDYFQKALDLLPENTNLKLKSVVYSQMGYTAYLCNLYDKALEMHRGNYECGRLVKDTVSMIYGLMDMAVCQEMRHHLDSAEVLYSDAMLLAQDSHNEELKASLHTQISVMLLSQGKKDEALQHIRKSIEYDDPDNRSATYSAARNIYDEISKEDSAFIYNTRAMQCGNIYARQVSYGWLSSYYSKQGNSDSSLYYSILYKQTTDSVLDKTATETVARMNSLYNYQIREKENLRLKSENNKKQNLIVILTLIVLFSIIIVSYTIIYTKEKRRALRFKLEKYEMLLREAENRSNEQKQQRINGISNSDIYSQIRNILNDPFKSIRMSEVQWELLSREVNNAYPGFDIQLRDLCRMSLLEYRVCLLIKIGISPTDIARLIIKSPSSAGSIRSRLYEKAFGKKGTAKEWDKIIAAI